MFALDDSIRISVRVLILKVFFFFSNYNLDLGPKLLFFFVVPKVKVTNSCLFIPKIQSPRYD